MQLLWPLPAEWQKITTRHGEGGHIGIDISCPNGTPVYAAHAGTVKYEWTAGGGNKVRLTDASGEYTVYAHLQSYTADDREQVKAGDEIARSGNTGSQTTGAHLHFEVHELSGTLVDPLSVMEVPVTGKVGLHIQESRDWLPALVSKYWNYKQADYSWVKVINPAVPDIYQNTHILGRAFWHDNNNSWESDCIKQGAIGAEAYFNYHQPYYAARKGIVTAWEGPNEPCLTSVQAAYQYSDFLFSWVGKMHRAGFKVCGGSIGVGNPRLSTFGESNDILAIILPALCQCDYWSYHAYWDGRLSTSDNWWAFRYREIYNTAKKLGYTLPPLIISECGCDHAGGKYDGWRYRVSWDDHFSDIKLFRSEIAKDSYVEGATLFDVAPANDWVYFEYDEAQCKAIGEDRLVQTITEEIPHEGLPTDETATDAKTLVQKARWWLEEEQRQREAGNTGYAERIRLALIQLLYRAENAL